MPEVRFPVHPDSLKERPFIPEVYFQRTGAGMEVGLVNRRGEAYGWTVVPIDQFNATLNLLNIEDQFDAAGT